MIVTVANVKGGVGKTTAALMLGHVMPATVVDADPQGSAIAWAEAAAEAGSPLRTPVVSLPTPRLAGRLPAAEHLVIDTPPGDLAIITAAIGIADVVLVPTASSALDMTRVWATLDLAAQAGKSAVVLLSRVRVGTRSAAVAAEALAEEGVRVLAARIPLREGLALAFGDPISLTYGYEDVAAELMEGIKR
jgi:chromosome partitioning protein